MSETPAKAPVKAFVRDGMLALAPQAFMLDLMMLEPLVYERPFTVEGRAAVVEIRGTLTHHAENSCLDSYDAIRERMRAALHSDTACVIMRIDSLGGDVAGCFDLATWIRREATEHGKRLLAYTDGTAASAAYAIACVADEIGVGLTGFVGSVGIINAILDQTALDAAQGLRYGFATSGARKADGNPHTPITDEAMASLQEQVNELAGVFFAHVAAHRPSLTPAILAGLEARLFFGASAVAQRLADRVCSWGEMVSLAADPNVPTKAATTMPKYLEEARKMAAKMVEDGDDGDREMAKKMMALFGDDEPEKKEEAKAEGEEPEKKPEAKAEAEDEKKPEAKAKAAYGEGEKDSEKMKAAAAAASTLDFIRELHELKAERAAEKAQAERAQLLATRPDFDAKTRAWLDGASLETVRKAVETIPRLTVNPAAASQAMGTRGSYSPEAGSDSDALHIAKYMGGLSPKVGVQASGFAGRHLEFNPMTPAEARARLAELEKGSQ